jgi:hypothetical protein
MEWSICRGSSVEGKVRVGSTGAAIWLPAWWGWGIVGTPASRVPVSLGTWWTVAIACRGDCICKDPGLSACPVRSAELPSELVTTSGFASADFRPWSPSGEASAPLGIEDADSDRPSFFLSVFFTLARWFWNQTWTTRTLNPVSWESLSRTFLHGFGFCSKIDLKRCLWLAVRIVLGLFGAGAWNPNAGSWSVLLNVGLGWGMGCNCACCIGYSSE